ncbi:hypothetical protein QQY66_05290 [Streptomyces sp. DG2A-72]|uniref:hypothetical protein n=1 Tax=Streptomyces sp. DG2A-72 TaxID=3051386 RepID=UPI00265C1E20|nr:hypothetical protein [Streptomyces sp. DG2A-72]MDO0931122.1 hypothetical protein [Streptomyces sp. DG2A-72]
MARLMEAGAARLTEAGTVRLLRRASLRRADGSRGMRARRAWGRLVRPCAAGDTAAQDAVRASELLEADVLELSAVGPEGSLDRAAYLTLIGQSAQRQSLDPDGSLLAPVHRAAVVTGASTLHLREQGRGRWPDRVEAILDLGGETVRSRLYVNCPEIVRIHSRHESIALGRDGTE